MWKSLTQTLRTAGWLGCALWAAAPAGWSRSTLADEPPVVITAETLTPARGGYMSIIESMIDDAMQDGSLSLEERRLILAQARRRLAAGELAEIESRIASLPSPTSTLGVPQGNLPEPMKAASGETSSASATPSVDACKPCCDPPGCGGLFDNMYYFANVEGWQGPLDDDANPNNFGYRLGLNLGFPLLECRGIGGQLGMSYAMYNFHGRGDNGADNNRSSVEQHLMMTVGVFQRADLCGPCPQPWSWGVAYDRLYADDIGEDADHLYIGQWRLQVGYALSAKNEIGFWTTQGDESRDLTFHGTKASPIHQYNFFWHHKWDEGADTRVWLGLAEEPGQLVLGTDSNYPLNDCLALVGSAQYIWPSASPGESGGGVSQGFAQEAWNVSVGLAYYPGGNAKTTTVAGRRWMPYFNVADNGSFALKANGD